MKPKSSYSKSPSKAPAEQVVKDIRRQTRRHFSAEDKIRIDEQSQLPVKRALDPTGLTANPKGCWDWWGYSGPDYFRREGQQMQAVHGMIERLLPQ